MHEHRTQRIYGILSLCAGMILFLFISTSFFPDFKATNYLNGYVRRHLIYQPDNRTQINQPDYISKKVQVSDYISKDVQGSDYISKKVQGSDYKTQKNQSHDETAKFNKAESTMSGIRDMPYEFWKILHHKTDVDLYFNYVYYDPSRNRLIGVFLAIKTLRYKNLNLTCSLHLGDTSTGKQSYDIKGTVKTPANMGCYPIKGVGHCPFILFCSLQNTTLRFNILEHSFVELYENQQQSKSTNNSIIVPVVVSENRTAKTDNPPIPTIGVCISAQYGYSAKEDIPYFIQWMELLQMLGISEFHIYNMLQTFHDDFRRVMAYYESNAVLKLHRFPTPFADLIRNDTDVLGNSAHLMVFSSINDCMYRNLKRYDYILFIDLDEVPVLHQFSRYQDLLRNRSLQFGEKDICFKSAFYYRFYPNDTTDPKQHGDQYNQKLILNSTITNSTNDTRFPMMAFTKRNPTENIGIGFSKCLVNTKRCTLMWNHRCLHFNGLSPAQDTHVLLPESHALIHHYRTSCRMGKRCETEAKRMFNDKSPFLAKYGEELEKRTLNVLNNLNLG